MKTAIIVPHVTLGYYRNCRTHLIEVTLGSGRTIKRGTVHPTLFLTVFPALDRRWTGGTVDANHGQLHALGLGPKPQRQTVDLSSRRYPQLTDTIGPKPQRQTVELADMPHQVRYVYVPQIGRIIAKLIGTSQELSSNPQHFQRVTGVSSRAVLGSISLMAAQARELGFIIAEGGFDNDRIFAELLPSQVG